MQALEYGVALDPAKEARIESALSIATDRVLRMPRETYLASHKLVRVLESVISYGERATLVADGVVEDETRGRLLHATIAIDHGDGRPQLTDFIVSHGAGGELPIGAFFEDPQPDGEVSPIQRLYNAGDLMLRICNGEAETYEPFGIQL